MDRHSGPERTNRTIPFWSIRGAEAKSLNREDEYRRSTAVPAIRRKNVRILNEPEKKRVSGSLVLVASARELAIPGVAWQQKRNRGSNWDRDVFGFRMEQSRPLDESWPGICALESDHRSELAIRGRRRGPGWSGSFRDRIRFKARHRVKQRLEANRAPGHARACIGG